MSSYVTVAPLSTPNREPAFSAQIGTLHEVTPGERFGRGTDNAPASSMTSFLVTTTFGFPGALTPMAAPETRVIHAVALSRHAMSDLIARSVKERTYVIIGISKSKQTNGT